MRDRYVAILMGLGLICSVGLGVSTLFPSDKAEAISVVIKSHDYGEPFKIFEDGVTYQIDERFGGDKYTYILHDGEKYDCIGLGYHLTPMCVEIIMRSIP